eukprot:8191774-Pyramimonas_sp.AAC.1
MQHNRGREANQRLRGNVGARWYAAPTRETLGTARALRAGVISSAGAGQMPRRSCGANAKRLSSRQESLLVAYAPPNKPIPLPRMPAARRQERPHEVGDQVRAATSTETEAEEKGHINRAECSPRHEPARVAKTVGLRRTYLAIRDDGTALAEYGPVLR